MRPRLAAAKLFCMFSTSSAIVRPRVLSPRTGEAFLLEDVVAAHLSAGDRGVIELSGGPLTGKTTAIEYLDRVFADERHLALVDEHAQLWHRPGQWGVTVSTSLSEAGTSSLGRYRLASWGRDEWIEYLLAAHKSRCSSVIGRLVAKQDLSLLEGNPRLWRLVLDELAEDDSIPSATESLRRLVDRLYSSSDLHTAIRRFALVAAAPMKDELDREARVLAKLAIERPVLRLLALEPVRTILAAEALMSQLAAGGECFFLRRRLPYSLVREASLAVQANETFQAKLGDILLGNDPSLQPMAASLLHASGIGWKPTRPPATIFSKLRDNRSKLPDLSSAYLNEATWPGIDLREAQLSGAKLADANLENADLAGANVNFADLTSVKLHGASLAKLQGCGAELARADLSFARAPGVNLGRANLEDANLEGALLTDASLAGANLIGARFVRANLSQAQLVLADITGADFTQANLAGSSLESLDLRLACFDFAIFANARLKECNLEAMELPGADFRSANLRQALLTGSIMSNASFQGANLQGAGLADVEWEGVDLRNADLREASFHLGSTRSGLVGSPYPSHGTRTGFYTDEFGEQDFKSPEEIRKANLRGADLRGARIDGVDFYLVDVRDAHYDPQQEAHLRQCGAILKTRTV